MEIFRHLPAAADRSIALTIGNFDGVHYGHQAMISKLKGAARRHSIPACVLTFEPHPREFLYPQNAPVRLTDRTEKAALLRSNGVDRLYVCPFNTEMANMPPELFVSRVLVAQLGVRWLLIGDDFRFGARREGDLALLRRLGQTFGFHVEAMTTVSIGGERVSSTAVREAWIQGDASRVARLLARTQPPRPTSGTGSTATLSPSRRGEEERVARSDSVSTCLRGGSRIAAISTSAIHVVGEIVGRRGWMQTQRCCFGRSSGDCQPDIDFSERSGPAQPAEQSRALDQTDIQSKSLLHSTQSS